MALDWLGDDFIKMIMDAEAPLQQIIKHLAPSQRKASIAVPLPTAPVATAVIGFG